MHVNYLSQLNVISATSFTFNQSINLNYASNLFNLLNIRDRKKTSYAIKKSWNWFHPAISTYIQCGSTSSTHESAIISTRTNQNEISIGYFWRSHPYQNDSQRRVSIEIMGKLVFTSSKRERMVCRIILSDTAYLCLQWIKISVDNSKIGQWFEF